MSKGRERLWLPNPFIPHSTGPLVWSETLPYPSCFALCYGTGSPIVPRWRCHLQLGRSGPAVLRIQRGCRKWPTFLSQTETQGALCHFCCSLPLLAPVLVLPAEKRTTRQAPPSLGGVSTMRPFRLAGLEASGPWHCHVGLAMRAPYLTWHCCLSGLCPSSG